MPFVFGRGPLVLFALAQLWVCIAADACAGEIKVGFTKEQVLKELGKPTYVIGSGKKETLGYGTRAVVLVDGRVSDPGIRGASKAGSALRAGGDLRSRQHQKDAYIANLKSQLLRRSKQILSGGYKELRGVKNQIHRLQNKSVGIPPRQPSRGVRAEVWARYQRELRTYQTANAETQREIESLTRLRDRLSREYESAKRTYERLAELVSDYTDEELQNVIIGLGDFRPELEVGYVGFIGVGYPLQRIGTERELVSLSGIPGSPVVLATGFGGAGHWRFFPGVVEIVGTYTYTTVRDVSKTVFEIRPFVRDPCQDEREWQPEIAPEGGGAQDAEPTTPRSRHLRLGSGSGFLITSDGYVITSRHVVSAKDRRLTSLSLRLAGAKHPAKVVAVDTKNDLALLKTEGSFPCLSLHAGKDVPLGEDAYAIGYPMTGILGTNVKVTKGIVSSNVGTDGVGKGFFQLDAKAYPGNSGGPAVSADGSHVFGVLTAIGRESLDTVTFAVPASAVRDFLRRQASDVFAKLHEAERAEATEKPSLAKASKSVALVLVSFE